MVHEQHKYRADYRNNKAPEIQIRRARHAQKSENHSANHCPNDS